MKHGSASSCKPQTRNQAQKSWHVPDEKWSWHNHQRSHTDKGNKVTNPNGPGYRQKNKVLRRYMLHHPSITKQLYNLLAPPTTSPTFGTRPDLNYIYSKFLPDYFLKIFHCLKFYTSPFPFSSFSPPTPIDYFCSSKDRLRPATFLAICTVSDT